MAHMYCPEYIWEDHSLKLAEKNVYGVIEGLTKKEGFCYATNEFIGINLEMSGDTVSKHISSLAKKGKLKVEVVKTKKKLGSPQEWGTRRKIYIYFEKSSDGYLQKEVRGTSKNPSSIDIENKIDEGGARKDEPTPPNYLFPEVGKEKRFKRLPVVDQLEVLKLTMGIYEHVDLDGLLSRIKKSAGRSEILLTAYQWLHRDILEGKVATNYYMEGFRDDLPKTIEEAEYRMDRQLFLPKFKMELGDNGEVVTTQGINKTSPARLDQLKEKLESLERVETKNYDL